MIALVKKAVRKAERMGCLRHNVCACFTVGVRGYTNIPPFAFAQGRPP